MPLTADKLDHFLEVDLGIDDVATRDKLIAKILPPIVDELNARYRAAAADAPAPARPAGNHAAAINELPLSVVRKRGPAISG